MKLNAALGLLTLCLSAPLVRAQEPPAQPPAPIPDAPSKSRENRDGNFFSLAVFYWRTQGDPRMLGGKLSFDPSKQNVVFPGKPKETPGVELTFPAGKYNRIEISGFETRGSGTFTATKGLNIFGGAINTGDFLSVRYKVRNIKFDWNYLTYPVPPDAKLRVRTYIGGQYTRIEPVFDLPLLTNPATLAGKKSIIYPVFGLGVEFVPSKHFLFEVKGSGFGFPHRSVYWDGEATAIVRLGPVEVFGGGKAYHFKTSPQKEEYFLGTLYGPFGGLRFVF